MILLEYMELGNLRDYLRSVCFLSWSHIAHVELIFIPFICLLFIQCRAGGRKEKQSIAGADLLRYSSQIAHAMAYLEFQHIFHGDLSAFVCDNHDAVTHLVISHIWTYVIYSSFSCFQLCSQSQCTCWRGRPCLQGLRLRTGRRHLCSWRFVIHHSHSLL